MADPGTMALSVLDVSKRFRRVKLARNYSTLKDLLLRRKPDMPESARYTQALDQVSFDLPRGETWGIIGPNGSGKSTLLKLITGIYHPDRGNIRVNGKLASLIELGAGFHPDFSGRENVILNGIVLGMSKREVMDRFDEIVAFSELEEFIDEPVRTYSTGMYMRLAFSIAANVDPDVLLLDEILSVGDEAFTKKSQEKIRSFQERGKTLLMVSHNLNAVQDFCSHLLRFSKGRIVDSGPPGEVVERYRSGVDE